MKQDEKTTQSYVFLLKEGTSIKEDFLDYSVMMLHTNCLETLQSPKREKAELGRTTPFLAHLRDELRNRAPSSTPANR